MLKTIIEKIRGKKEEEKKETKKRRGGRRKKKDEGIQIDDCMAAQAVAIEITLEKCRGMKGKLIPITDKFFVWMDEVPKPDTTLSPEDRVFVLAQDKEIVKVALNVVRDIFGVTEADKVKRFAVWLAAKIAKVDVDIDSIASELSLEGVEV